MSLLLFALKLASYVVISLFVCFYHFLRIRPAIMLSDETFPKDFFYDDDDERGVKEEQMAATTATERSTMENRLRRLQEDEGEVEAERVRFSLSHETSKSVDNFSSFLSTSYSSSSSTTVDESMTNAIEFEKLLKSAEFKHATDKLEELELQAPQPEASFKSMNASAQRTSILPPPCAPIKKKKSFSCQDLQMKKNKYDHVESKVKKLIENLAEDRRKTLMRHTSMPVCTQTASIDEKSSDEEFDSKDLRRELRKKAVKIYDLEEKCEMKDNQIYQLECERAKMKMTFDKLRMEMEELKEVERQYKQLKSLTSPLKTLRNAQIQTEDSGFDDSSRFHLTTAMHSSNAISVRSVHHKNVNRLLSTGAIRQLAFDNSSNMNQSHFADVNNTSSDNLIPEQDPFMEDIDLAPTQGTQATTTAQTTEKKKGKSKKPKLRRFFRLVPCISKN